MSDQLAFGDATPECCPTCGRPVGDMEAPGKVGRKHPETSHTAATLPGFGTQRWRVLFALGDRHNATAAELADRCNLSRNQCATRLMELREGGYARYLYDDDGEPMRRATGLNTSGRVHIISALGRRVLDDRVPKDDETW